MVALMVNDYPKKRKKSSYRDQQLLMFAVSNIPSTTLVLCYPVDPMVPVTFCQDYLQSGVVCIL